jgi:secreted trypsin-like serine protease
MIAAPKPGTSVPSAAVNWTGDKGGATTAHPGVALLLAKLDGENQFTVHCSGTLVRQNVILTAAHCVCHPRHYPTGSVCRNGTETMDRAPLLDASRWRVFLQHVGVRRVSRVEIDDSYQFDKDAVHGDIAVLVLSRPVTSIIPTEIPPAADTASAWTGGWVAGFGFSANPDNPNASVLQQLVRPGLKSQGEITFADCDNPQKLPFLDPKASLCSLYATAAGTSSQATVCGGDSGGPLWMTGNTLFQIGVTSGRNRDNCADKETLAFQMSVAYRPHWTWISQRLTELGSAAERGKWPAFGENLRFVLDKRNAVVFDANGNYTSEGWVLVQESGIALATMNSPGRIAGFNRHYRK